MRVAAGRNRPIPGGQVGVPRAVGFTIRATQTRVDLSHNGRFYEWYVVRNPEDAETAESVNDLQRGDGETTAMCADGGSKRETQLTWLRADIHG